MKNILEIIFVIFYLVLSFNSHSLSQVLKQDDFQHKSDYWYWRADGNQTEPTVENGLLKLHLQNAINSEYCNTEIYDPTEPYSPGTHARIRLKCSTQHVGSRGWGLWDGDIDTNSIIFDFDVAWIMQQGSDDPDKVFNWSLFGVDNGFITDRQTFDLNNVVDETEWHTYNIVWRADSTLLYVDDLPLFASTAHLPDENMRLDLWIDNRVINLGNPTQFWNNNSEGSEMLVDFIEITGVDGPSIKRNESGNILLWKSPNTFPNGNKNYLWKEYNFTSSTEGEALIFLTASAESYNDIHGDDNLKIVFDNNDFGWDTKDSFDGDNLNGEGASVAIPLEISGGEHLLDIYSDITPFLRDVIVLFAPKGKTIFNTSYNEIANDNDGLWKSIQFNTANSDEVTILISGTGLENDNIRIELDDDDYLWKSDQSIDGEKLQGLPSTIVLNESLAAGSHTLNIFKKGNPKLFTIAIYGNSSITGLENVDNEPSLVLLQSNPNPFNNSTNITYQINEASDVSITIVNILGQEIITLVNEFKNKGKYTKVWNANNQTSGIYYCILESGNSFKIEKLLLLK